MAGLNLENTHRAFKITSSNPKFQGAMENIKQGAWYKAGTGNSSPSIEGETRETMREKSLFLASPPQFDVQSSFGPLFNFDPKKLKLAYEISSNIARRPDTFESLSAFGFQAWEGSSPLKITVELKFFKGMWGWNDARNEVFNPIALLVETVLPTEGAGGILISPSPNYYVGLTQLLHTYTTIGANILQTAGELAGGAYDALFSSGSSGSTAANTAGNAARNIANKIGSVILGFANSRAQSRGTYNLLFGNSQSKPLSFYNYICESAAPQFSLEVDDAGYPIWGAVRLSFASVFSANVSHFPMQFPGKRVIEPNPSGG